MFATSIFASWHWQQTTTARLQWQSRSTRGRESTHRLVSQEKPTRHVVRSAHGGLLSRRRLSSSTAGRVHAVDTALAAHVDVLPVHLVAVLEDDVLGRHAVARQLLAHDARAQPAVDLTTDNRNKILYSDTAVLRALYIRIDTYRCCIMNKRDAYLLLIFNLRTHGHFCFVRFLWVVAGLDCGGHLEIHNDIHNTDFVAMLSSVIFLMLGRMVV